MQEPKLQHDPLDRPIDLGRIRGPAPTQGAPTPDRSWMDAPISAPDANLDEPPSWFERAGHGFMEGVYALPRGAANALASGANLTNSAFRLLPGIDEDTPFFGRVPDHPLGTSDNPGAVLAEGIAQFGVGFVTARPLVGALGGVVKGAEILKGAQAGLSLTGNVAAGAVADFVAFDANAGRLTDLIGRIPGLEGLDLTSADDGEIEGRVKNALEGLGLGAAVDGMIRGVRAYRARGRIQGEIRAISEAAKADSAEALAEAIEKAQANPDFAVAMKQASDADIEAAREFRALTDMRLADQSPFKGVLVDDAVARATRQKDPLFINVDGSEAVGFTVLERTPTPGWADRQQPRFVELAAAKVGDPVVEKQLLTNWVNKHGTLLDNPQTTIKLNPDGTASIGVTLHADQWTPVAKKIADSIKASPGMTPAELGEAAQGLTRPRAPSPPSPPIEPPAGAGEAAAAMPAPKPPTPHQIYLGQIGFDDKTADEIGELLHGEFVDGMTERGEVAIAFKAKGELHTDASNPKRMTREQVFEKKLLEKGLNLEGLKGQPEVLAQATRTLEKMYVALREAENPLLVKETFAEMNARAQVEQDIVTGIPTIHDQSSYIKLAERAGVQNANRIGAQAKAFTNIAVGIAQDLVKTSADFVKRKKAGQAIEKWEYAAWAESRGLAKDALDTARNLKNALARNLYLQRGEIKPAGNVARMTSAQIQANPDLLEKILMENGGIGKIEADAASIVAAGGRDLHEIATVLNLAQKSHGLLGMTLEAGYAAMLSSLKTPMFQMFGNLSVAAYQPMRRAFSSAIHIPFTRDPKALAALKGELSEAIDTELAYFQMIPEALRGYKTGFFEGAKLNPRSGTFDVHGRASRQQITARNAQASLGRVGLQRLATGKAGAIINGVGAVVSGPSRALQGGDEMVRVLDFRAIAQARLSRMHKEAGLSGNALGVAVAEDMDRLVYKNQALSLDQLERRALDQVNRQGYTGIHAAEMKNRLVSEWGRSPWYKRLSGLAEFALSEGEEAAMAKQLKPGVVGDFGDVLARHPVLRFAISPFYRTSVNIAEFALQHLDYPHYIKWLAESKISRTGPTSAETANRLLSDMRSGDPVRQANARGRLVIGTVASSGVAALYMAGRVTGRGPSDKNLRKRMLGSGWQPYSFRLGDGTYASYKRFEPIATIIGLIADVSQTLEEVPNDRVAGAGDLAQGIGIALAANVTNKSYAQGLADFMEAITQPGAKFDDWVKSMATRFVPNIARDAAIAVDPMLREIRDTHDAMVAKIPYMWLPDLPSSVDLEPRRNVLGEPIERMKTLGEDSLGRWVAPFSIVQVSRVSDALKAELASMEHILGTPDSTRGGYDMFDIKTSSGQSSYDRWLENSGTVKLGGKTMRQALEAMVASSTYQKMSAEPVNSEPSQRAQMLNMVISRYRRFAFDKTQGEIPELNRAELDSRMARARR